jgi:hypothetical protein
MSVLVGAFDIDYAVALTFTLTQTSYSVQRNEIHKKVSKD